MPVDVCIVQILMYVLSNIPRLKVQKVIMQVEDVVVDQEQRGRGIGAALLDQLKVWAEYNGLARLQLAADRDNSAALGFYTDKGWKQTNLGLLRYSG